MKSVLLSWSIVSVAKTEMLLISHAFDLCSIQQLLLVAHLVALIDFGHLILVKSLCLFHFTCCGGGGGEGGDSVLN